MALVRNQERLAELVRKPGNNDCADCGQSDPEWASYNLGVFVCDQCAGIHRSLGAHISKIKSLRLDNWDDAQVEFMESHGNLSAKEKFEPQLPACYPRPTSSSAQVLREQWIRAKYERLEFTDSQRQTYLLGTKEGHLWKRGKDDKNFKRRRFVLSEQDFVLKYFTKEEAKSPKAQLRLDAMNLVLVPDKIGNPNGMQIVYQQNGDIRHLFVYAAEGKDLIDWYVAIRSAKLNRLRIAYPGTADSELCATLTPAFVKEGWLQKTGPKGDGFRKRWATLSGRILLYANDALDPHPKGAVFIGNVDQYALRQGLPPGMKDPGSSFTLKTPNRTYYFSAETAAEQIDWVEKLTAVLHKPMTLHDTSNMFKLT